MALRCKSTPRTRGGALDATLPPITVTGSGTASNPAFTGDLLANFPQALNSGSGFFSGGGTLTAPGVNGLLEEDELVEIVWDGVNGFGDLAPTYAHYDPLDGGANGVAIPTSAPLAGGNYLQVQNGAHYSTEFSRFGTSSALLYDYRASDNARHLRKNFTPHPNAKVRYRMFVPTGGALPDRAINGFGSARSSFKIAWLAANQDAFGSNDGPDLCIPTLTVGQNTVIGGNDNDMGSVWDKYPGNNNVNISTIFNYGEWWLCEALIDGVNMKQRIRHQTLTKGMIQYARSGISNFWGPETPQEWGTCNLVGYIRNEPDEPAFDGCRLYFNDYWIMTGDGADADVYLHNGSAFGTSSDIRHCQIEFWSNEVIYARIRKVAGVSLAGWSFVVQNALGNFVPYFGNINRVISN